MKNWNINKSVPLPWKAIYVAWLAANTDDKCPPFNAIKRVKPERMFERFPRIQLSSGCVAKKLREMKKLAWWIVQELQFCEESEIEYYKSIIPCSAVEDCEPKLRACKWKISENEFFIVFSNYRLLRRDFHFLRPMRICVAFNGIFCTEKILVASRLERLHYTIWLAATSSEIRCDNINFLLCLCFDATCEFLGQMFFDFSTESSRNVRNCLHGRMWGNYFFGASS